MENKKTPEALFSEIERLQAVVDSLNEKLIQFGKRSEQDMNERLALTLKNIPLAIVNLDRFGQVTAANPAFLKVFDLESSDIVDKLNIKQFGPFLETELSQRIADLIDSLIEFDIETPFPQRPDTYFRCKGIKISNDISKALSFIIIIGDVSKRKQTEHELIKAKEKAEESDKLKTAFLTSMSHEIRTPMNHIIGFLDFLKDPELPAEEREEYSQIIYDSGQVLLRLIDDIIDVAKIEAGQMRINKTSFLLNEFMKTLYKKYHELAIKKGKEHIHFEFVTNDIDKSIVVETDSVRLQQILGNLLDNAFKFTEKGSISFGYGLSGDNKLQFFVEDTGPGIHPDKHELIFKRFRQLDYSSTKRYGGTGLGLAIIKGLVELMHGRIWLESETGEGAKFYFTLPDSIVHMQLKENTAKPDNRTVYDWSSKTIMIVEDEHTNYNLLNIMLRPTKVTTMWAKDGREAIDMVQANKQIDLILMDIRMPNVDGYMATSEIKRLHKSLPIIAQTAYAMDAEINKAMQAGCDDYIAKPIEKALLLSRIDLFFSR
jgi:signal transduction histidine kinase